MSAPLILCGPVVRRVDRDSATVFLVLREPKDVTLSVLGAGGATLMSGSRRTIKLGEHLYAVAVTARGDSALEWGGKYHYDLEFASPSNPNDKAGLYDDDVLVRGPAWSATPLQRLVYEGETLPSFMLPPVELGGVRYFHGSCRKPHGYGRDTLRRADQLLGDSLAGRRPRAQMFFMTGDQIYADDVHAELGASLSRFATETRGDGVHGGTRLALVRQAGFTTGKPDNHLVSLGEYIAMYLFTLSREPWYGRPKDANLASFYDDLPYVRRLFANVATYMMFDDHEVTDDWFIHHDWTEKVLGDALGRKILRNGLLAYTVFQHWGNVPDMFEPGAPGGKLLAKLDDWHSADVDRLDEMDHLLGLPKHADELARDKPGAIAWGYRLQGPSFEAIVLDTRMSRAFEPSNGRTSLMSKDHLQRELATSSPPPFTIVVSATPVLGLTRLESLQGITAKLGLDEPFDVECWARSSSHRTLVDLLLARSPVVVLSGDVHFGLSAQVLESGQRTRCVVNFTSSAFKNAPATWWERQALGAAGGTTLRGLGDKAMPVDATVARSVVVELDEKPFEETLLIGDEGQNEGLSRGLSNSVTFAAPREAVMPGVRAVPHAHTVATPWCNLGEVCIDVAQRRIIQMMYYDRNGVWAARADSSIFPL